MRKKVLLGVRNWCSYCMEKISLFIMEKHDFGGGVLLFLRLQNCYFFLYFYWSSPYSRATQVRILLNEINNMNARGGSRKWRLQGSSRYLIIDTMLEEVKIVVLRKASTWESVAQSNCFWRRNILEWNSLLTNGTLESKKYKRKRC